MNKGVTYAGDLRIYSVPSALVAHVEWAINQLLGQSHQFDWIPQPISPGSFGLEFGWKLNKSIAAKLAISLKGWHFIRFEVRENNSRGSEGTLFRCTPDLGLHQVTTGSTGDVMIPENQIRNLIKLAMSQKKLQSTLENAIGAEWDEELEPFRIALAERGQETLSQIG
ncbi:MAG: DUF3145 family protein [Actinobacteria bacterium]|uniref:Unannotated protein n=1 Tax=freshwater metagenome TaxID=449393 RepID=A0A6J6HD00_9ZZZZ|nr:DUF3145 family protein [Actinomycetota bacterium]